MFCDEQKTTKDDIIVILGDAGINYNADISDFSLKQKLNKMPISFFCIHGNHEIRPQNISSYDYAGVPDFGTVLREPEFPNIMFGVDGYVYNLGGHESVVIGGAYSVDKYYRLMRGAKWFADEQPSDETKRFVEKTIRNFGNSIELVLSHTCPAKYIPTEMFLSGVDQSTVDNSTEDWLGQIEESLTYKLWLCGHYHTDKSIDKMRFMFNDIICLEDLLCQ